MQSNATRPKDETVGHIDDTLGSKTIVTIVSTMRSGSTLLKAQLAEAPDVSNLPEVNFQRFQSKQARAEIERIDPAPILVLKRPAWFHETSMYPRLPRVRSVRFIVLVRDCYETVQSLKKMLLPRAHTYLGAFTNRWLVCYWTKVVANIHQLSQHERAVLVRYEDLVADPISQSAKLFRFIGSRRRSGVDSYQVPRDFEWKWGRDDGGNRIKSLRVLPAVPHNYEDRRLLEVIAKCRATMELRSALGYDALRLH